jgi:glycosyltransferase involved in cell wall biosynthesis
LAKIGVGLGRQAKRVYAVDGSAHESGVAVGAAATKPKLAIVSTYDELCGIAAYTVAIKKQLDPHFDITVFELDQYLLRHTNARVRKMGDAHIKSICDALKDFPMVNIQLEYGTFGSLNRDILRRMKMVFDASRALTITFHTVLSPPGSQWGEAWRSLKTGRVVRSFKNAAAPYLRSLGNSTYKHLLHLQKRKNVQVIVHTGRDARMMRFVLGFENVHHHPLAFFTDADANAIKKSATRKGFAAFRKLKSNDVIIGLFGFLGPYKGFETVFRSLHWLPKNYHIAVFGGVHPQAIKRDLPIDPYVQTLIKTAHAEEPGLVTESRGLSGLPQMLLKNNKVADLLQANAKKVAGRDPHDLSDRIHFMGPLSDAEFAKGMAVCDVVVLPYLEVGQSSSGPISMAVELGKRIIASRTQAYMQFEKYHLGRIAFFDIGNHIELAQRIEHPERTTFETSSFDWQSNIELYKKALLS